MQQFNLTNISSPFVPPHLTKYLAWGFSDFTHFSPHISSISAYASKRIFTQEKRDILVDVLKKQYTAIWWNHAPVKNNITTLLDPNTFTLTTGQQVHLLWWPMFFMTKIMDVIALSKQMNEKTDGKTYVPVFWMASEDHDLDEIMHVNVYGERFERDTIDTWGPVGRYSTKWLDRLIKQLEERLDDTPENQAYLDLRAHAYTTFPTLAQATHRVVDQLFGEQWLLVLDADDTQLKGLFSEIMRKDLVEQSSHTPLVEQTALLEEVWLKWQAIPKEINLFYMTDTQRSRIEADAESKDSKGEISFAQSSHKDIASELLSHPEKFSPNVFLRTIYQETILPNLVYLAGPGEIKYWLQMKTMFEVYGEQMPVLLPRQLTQYLNEKSFWIINESGIELPDWFGSYDDFMNLLKVENAEEQEELHVVLESWQWSVARMEKSMQWKSVDKNVAKSVKNIRSELETLERRLEQAEQAGLEWSKVYGKLLKLQKKSFSGEKRFERDQFVVGNVGLFEEMRKDWEFGDGVKVVVS